MGLSVAADAAAKIKAVMPADRVAAGDGLARESDEGKHGNQHRERPGAAGKGHGQAPGGSAASLAVVFKMAD